MADDITEIARELRLSRGALVFSQELRASLGGKGPLSNIEVRPGISAVRRSPDPRMVHAHNFTLDQEMAALQTETLADTLLIVEQRLEAKIKRLADALVIAAAAEARP